MKTKISDKLWLIVLALSMLLASCTNPAPASPDTPSPQVANTSEAIQPLPDDDPVLSAEVVHGWEFAKSAQALGWVATHDLRLFETNQEGIVTGSTGGDPYMVGPAIAIEAETAPYIVVRMRSSKGADAQIFWEVDGEAFNEGSSMHFAVEADNAWHTYVVAVKNSANWTGKITRVRLDPSNNEGAELAIEYIRLMGPAPAKLAVEWLSTQAAILPEYRPFQVRAVVRNVGDQVLEGESLALAADQELKLTEGTPSVALNALQAGESMTLTWMLQGPEGVFQYYLKSAETIIKQAAVVLEKSANGTALTIGNETLRISFPKNSFGYGVGTVEWFDGTNWRIAGRMSSLGQIAYLDKEQAERRILLYAAEGTVNGNDLTFTSTFTDSDGTLWQAETSFSIKPNSNLIDMRYRLKASQTTRLLAWVGPEYLAGEGSFGTTRDSALFPGLEYLLGTEQSSGDDYFDTSVAQRYVPHPNKVTIPFMAVTVDGMTTGLIWDPLEKWDAEHDRPAVLFASPNSWQGQENHLMRLFVPGATAGLPENRDILAGGLELKADETLQLHAQLFADTAADPLAPLDVWLRQHTLPDLPELAGGYEAANQHDLVGYLKSTYDAPSKGWHYALQDPWGPGANAAVALHLELAGLDQAETAEGQAMRDVARASTNAIGTNGGPTPWYYQYALAMLRGDTTADLTKPYINALVLLQAQQNNGSWSFTPSNRTGRPFGELGDTSSGWTATHALQVIYSARITGNKNLVDASIKALDFLMSLPLRPEGAQTWELPLHVPDLLASAWVSQVFVEGYRLTGDTKYLVAAERWALAGLPFIYMWSAPDRELMSYGTIPVFGATNYSYPWIGKPVMWNGLDYAIGLQSLDTELQNAGLPKVVDWRKLAEGITIATYQMQATEGQFEGMYPDAWDVVTGEEAYSWWLIPAYLHQSLLLVQDHPHAQALTQILPLGAGKLHISSVLPGMTARMEGQVLNLALGQIPGEFTTVMVSPLDARPDSVLINGQEILTTGGWMDPSGAWQFSQGILFIRVPRVDSGAQVRVTLRK